MAMCLPTAVSLITNTFPKGRWRTTCFAMNGMAQPLGYALGLVLGGVFTDSVGWRWAYWIMAMLNAIVSVMAVWALPQVKHPATKSVVRRILEDVDWVGVIGLSASLAIIMYILASKSNYCMFLFAHWSGLTRTAFTIVVTSDYRNISHPSTIALLIISLLVLLAAFPLWMHYQILHSRPALIPNRLWRQPAFTAACLGVFFCWASLNGIEYFTTL